MIPPAQPTPPAQPLTLPILSPLPGEGWGVRVLKQSTAAPKQAWREERRGCGPSPRPPAVQPHPCGPSLGDPSGHLPGRADGFFPLGNLNWEHVARSMGLSVCHGEPGSCHWVLFSKLEQKKR